MFNKTAQEIEREDNLILEILILWDRNNFQSRKDVVNLYCDIKKVNAIEAISQIMELYKEFK